MRALAKLSRAAPQLKAGTEGIVKAIIDDATGGVSLIQHTEKCISALGKGAAHDAAFSGGKVMFGAIKFAGFASGAASTASTVASNMTYGHDLVFKQGAESFSKVADLYKGADFSHY